MLKVAQVSFGWYGWLLGWKLTGWVKSECNFFVRLSFNDFLRKPVALLLGYNADMVYWSSMQTGIPIHKLIYDPRFITIIMPTFYVYQI